MPSAFFSCEDNEWGLLSSTNVSHSGSSSVSTCIKSLQEGRYSELLQIEVLGWQFFAVETSAERMALQKHDWNSFVKSRVESLIKLCAESDLSTKELQMLVLCHGIACLQSFIQQCWTGPCLNFTSIDICARIGYEIGDQSAIFSLLASDNEAPYHLMPDPLFLLVARLIFTDCADMLCELETLSWWAFRSAFVHQKTLENPSASLYDLMLGLISSVEKSLDKAPLSVKARFQVECGLVYHHHTRDVEAQKYFTMAQKTHGLSWEMSGALGKRTKFQEREIAQLTILASSSSLDSEKECHQIIPVNLPLNDDTLLEKVHFTETSTESKGSLAVLDQCILLAFCLNYKNLNASDGLVEEQLFSFVNRVLETPGDWLTYTMALLLRSRFESRKSRTVERGALQLQALVDQFALTEPTNSERQVSFFSLAFPAKWELERELGERFLSIGALRSALQIFEKLEMWEDVITCYRNMESNAKAEEIVLKLLEEQPDSPKYLCLLGDLRQDDKLYVKAWEISGCRYARAMRSLGSFFFRRQQFDESIQCYQKALDINPLFQSSWFVMGCAAMRVSNWDVAVLAFNRVTSLEPDNAEAWTNLASVFIRQSKKVEAWRALREALKAMFDSFKIWENYLYTSIDIGEFEECISAVRRLVDLRYESKKSIDDIIDPEIIGILVDVVSKGTKDRSDLPASRLMSRLIEVLEYVCQKITASPKFLRSLALLYRSAKQYRKCLDTLTKEHSMWLNHVDLCLDERVFESAVESAINLCQAYEELGPQSEELRMGLDIVCKDWKYRCRLTLRTLASRTKEAFESSPKHEELLALLKSISN